LLDIFESSIFQILLKSVQWEPNCSMQTDRWTDSMMKLYAFLWIIPLGITQKKAYNIQNTANFLNQE